MKLKYKNKKGFNKVWHQDLLYNLKQNGVLGNLLETLTNFLKDQNSPWANVEAEVPKGSILGLLLLLIYIDDLSDNLSTNVKLFADDTTVFCSSLYHHFFLRLELWFKQSKNGLFSRKWALILNLSKEAQEVYVGRDGPYAKHFQCEFNVSWFSLSSVKFDKCF